MIRRKRLLRLLRRLMRKQSSLSRCSLSLMLRGGTGGWVWGQRGGSRSPLVTLRAPLLRARPGERNSSVCFCSCCCLGRRVIVEEREGCTATNHRSQRRRGSQSLAQMRKIKRGNAITVGSGRKRSMKYSALFKPTAAGAGDRSMNRKGITFSETGNCRLVS